MLRTTGDQVSDRVAQSRGRASFQDHFYGLQHASDGWLRGHPEDHRGLLERRHGAAIHRGAYRTLSDGQGRQDKVLREWHESMPYQANQLR